MFLGEHDATKQLENPLWEYSIEQYQKPGCAEFLLNAQNQYHLDVNILLFIGWLATQGKCYQEDSNIQRVHTWQTRYVSPIRQIRLRAKHVSNRHFYETIKHLELSAEHSQQALLFTISQKWPDCELSKDEVFKLNLREYLAYKPVLEDKSWLQALYQHLQP